ncbi:MAG: hypothetical protein JJT77_05050 [Crocinitomicaceae bacterium]|nr:hypothetical protein [Crocinitomicaceae bacterium]
MMTLEKFEQFENKSSEQFLSPESFVFIQEINPFKIDKEELSNLRNQELDAGRISAENIESRKQERPSIIRRILGLRIASNK